MQVGVEAAERHGGDRCGRGLAVVLDWGQADISHSGNLHHDFLFDMVGSS